MSKKDATLEKEKRIKEHLLTLSKEQIIELYLQVKFERDYLEAQYVFPKGADERIRCCFCGKEIDFLNSHDPRPIISQYGSRCCLECNNNIVCPTRENTVL